MEISKIKRIKLAIEQFFYRIKFNIGLHKAYTSNKHQQFQSDISIALKKQYLYYAKVEKVSEIVGIEKAGAKKKDLLDNLLSIWIPILDILDQRETENYLVDVANTAGNYALGKLNSGETFELTNEKLISRVKSRVPEMAKEIDKTTQSWLVRTINEGLARKMSFVEIAKSIRDKAKMLLLQRSQIIAEYESARVFSEIELEVFKRNSVQFVKWITSRDEKVCPRCNSNQENGETPVGDKFATGVTEPPDHIRCRCFLLPIVQPELEITWTGK